MYSVKAPAPANDAWWQPFCRFTSDGRGFVVGHSSGIRVWNAETGQLDHECALPPGDNGGSGYIVLAPAGRNVLVFDESRNAPLFLDLDSGKRVELPAFRAAGSTRYLGKFARLVAFAPNGVGFILSDWDTSAKQHFARFFKDPSVPAAAVPLPDEAEYLAYSHDGRLAVSIARYVPVKEHKGEEGICLIDVPAGRVIATATTSVSAYGLPAFSPDGRTLATGQMRWPRGMNLSGSWPPASTQLWDVPSLRQLATLREESLVGWCPDGRLVTASEEFLSSGPDVRVRDGRSGALIGEHRLEQPRSQWLPDTFRSSLMAAQFNSSPPAWRTWLSQHISSKLFSATDTSYLQVVDIATGRVVGVLPETTEDIAISPDGRTAAVADQDGVRIWDLPPRRPVGLILGLMIAEVALAIAWSALRRRRRRMPCAAS
jgi:WD40 repeat protein